MNVIGHAFTLPMKVIVDFDDGGNMEFYYPPLMYPVVEIIWDRDGTHYVTTEPLIVLDSNVTQPLVLEAEEISKYVPNGDQNETVKLSSYNN